MPKPGKVSRYQLMIFIKKVEILTEVATATTTETTKTTGSDATYEECGLWCTKKRKD